MTDIQHDKVTINGVTYVKEGATPTPSQSHDGMEFVVVRSYGAGVFFGYLDRDHDDFDLDYQRVVLRNVRRLHYWEGAASLSQVAMEGVKSPDKCRVPRAIDFLIVLGVIEVISTTAAAQKSLENIKIWKM